MTTVMVIKEEALMEVIQMAAQMEKVQKLKWLSKKS